MRNLYLKRAHFLFRRGLGRVLFLAGKREVSRKFALYAILLLGVQKVLRPRFPLLYKEKRGFLRSPVSDKKQNRPVFGLFCYGGA